MYERSKNFYLCQFKQAIWLEDCLQMRIQDCTVWPSAVMDNCNLKHLCRFIFYQFVWLFFAVTNVWTTDDKKSSRKFFKGTPSSSPKVSLVTIFVVLACHSPALDGFEWHFQAYVLFTLRSTVNKSQRTSKNSREFFSVKPGIKHRAARWEARMPPLCYAAS